MAGQLGASDGAAIGRRGGCLMDFDEVAKGVFMTGCAVIAGYTVLVVALTLLAVWWF